MGIIDLKKNIVKSTFIIFHFAIAMAMLASFTSCSFTRTGQQQSVEVIVQSEEEKNTQLIEEIIASKEELADLIKRLEILEFNIVNTDSVTAYKDKPSVESAPAALANYLIEKAPLIQAENNGGASVPHVAINKEERTLAGQTYENAIVFTGWGGTYCIYNLGYMYTRLTGTLGHIDNTKTDNVQFVFYGEYGDNIYKELAAYDLTKDSLPIRLDIDVSSVRGLKILKVNGGWSDSYALAEAIIE
jgi:hypothetical protein